MAQVILADPTLARGVDVSAWQRKWTAEDWARVARAGYSFAFIKAVEGCVEDTAFANHWALAKHVGLLRGAYGYLHVGRAVRPQAEALVDVMRLRGAGELPCVVDVETAEDCSSVQVTNAVCEWIDIVHEATEREPIVYTYPSFATSHLLGELLAECPLWIAQYGVDQPHAVPGWKRWDFWQWTGRGGVPGISGHVDLNVFNGSFAELCAAYGVTP